MIRIFNERHFETVKIKSIRFCGALRTDAIKYSPKFYVDA